MKTILAVSILFTLVACSNTPAPVAESPSSENTELESCPEQRPQMCTKIYKPVCATKDTGVRCVTTPCPSTEKQTYGNECTACADDKVLGYQHGACPEDGKQD